MACIYKRGKTWSYSVDLGRDESGKRKKKGKGGFRTQKEAKEAATILEAELANGVFVDEKKVTFGELADQWLAEHSKEIKPTTKKIYQSSINKLKSYLGKQPAKDITRSIYQKTLTALYERNIARGILQNINMCANMIFKYACQHEILKANPTQYAKIPKSKSMISDMENELPKYLEKEQLQLFLETIRHNESHFNYTVFVTLAYTGVRRGELIALKWDDIDFNNKTISISKNVYHLEGGIKNFLLQTPKTKTSKRIIPVTDNVLRELSQLRRQQKQEQMLHRKEWYDENFIFTSRHYPGYPMGADTIERVMRRNLNRAELNPALTPHSLRHTHTSLLAEAGVSLEAIMERLGHANDAITRTIYLHITKDVKKDAAQKFFELMNGIGR